MEAFLSLLAAEIPHWPLLGCSVVGTGCCAGTGRAAGTVGHWWHYERHPHLCEWGLTASISGGLSFWLVT